MHTVLKKFEECTRGKNIIITILMKDFLKLKLNLHDSK